MVDIQVENKKGMELIFGPHQTLLIHCPPHVLHLLWGDFTKPNRSFIQQLNFAGNWIDKTLTFYVNTCRFQQDRKEKKPQRSLGRRSTYHKVLILVGILILKKFWFYCLGLVICRLECSKTLESSCYPRIRQIHRSK